MTEAIKPELVERMVALVRSVSDRAEVGDTIKGWFAMPYEIGTEASCIVAELPAPIDPDLLLAREVAASHRYTQMSDEGQAPLRKAVAAGLRDEWDCVQVALAAIKKVYSILEEKR